MIAKKLRPLELRRGGDVGKWLVRKRQKEGEIEWDTNRL